MTPFSLLLSLLEICPWAPRSEDRKINPACRYLSGLSLRYYEMRTGLLFCFISNAHVSVEIFFCVTGILIAKKNVRRTLSIAFMGEQH